MPPDGRSQLDAVFLRQALPALPGRSDEHHPETLELNGHVAIRGQLNPQLLPNELILSQSRREGEQLCGNLNREFLTKAVQLSFREVHFSNSNTPAFCVDERRKYLFAQLNAEGAIKPRPDMLTIRFIAPETVTINSRPTPDYHFHVPVPTSNAVTPVKPIEAAIDLQDSLRVCSFDFRDVSEFLQKQR